MLFDTEDLKMSPDEKEIKRKLRVLKHAQDTGNIHKTCRYFGKCEYHQ